MTEDDIDVIVTTLRLATLQSHPFLVAKNFVYETSQEFSFCLCIPYIALAACYHAVGLVAWLAHLMNANISIITWACCNTTVQSFNFLEGSEELKEQLELLGTPYCQCLAAVFLLLTSDVSTWMPRISCMKLLKSFVSYITLACYAVTFGGFRRLTVTLLLANVLWTVRSLLASMWWSFTPNVVFLCRNNNLTSLTAAIFVPDCYFMFVFYCFFLCFTLFFSQFP